MKHTMAVTVSNNHYNGVTCSSASSLCTMIITPLTWVVKKSTHFHSVSMQYLVISVHHDHDAANVGGEEEHALP